MLAWAGWKRENRRAFCCSPLLLVCPPPRSPAAGLSASLSDGPLAEDEAALACAGRGPVVGRLWGDCLCGVSRMGMGRLRWCRRGR